jgi:hypothetical protein
MKTKNASPFTSTLSNAETLTENGQSLTVLVFLKQTQKFFRDRLVRNVIEKLMKTALQPDIERVVLFLPAMGRRTGFSVSG